MSNTDLIIPQRSRDIGDFLVGRFIPFVHQRMVGPFSFIDHMGPTNITPGKNFDVDQHPHSGLSTLTYLLEGEIMHKDSTGTEQRIKPGSVNWMTAGKGVTHTERQPDDLRGKSYTMNGYQIWVALPKDLEEMEPEFHHIAAEELPVWNDGDAQFKLIAGKGYGRESPVPVHSELFMLEIITQKDYELSIENELVGEIGIVIEKGQITACENTIEPGNMLVSKTENICKLKIAANSHLLLFGGKPFPEKRYIDWNFVSSSKEKIEEVVEKWQNKAFPKVPGDDTYVPYPPKSRLRK
ncbi:pirin family protein [Jiulongibacter sp. NS-SX5]|uniref:pirin family protein n=1 Tax=Jiulongibacter sp. NS-SX5 TaxID=3463854 RepID=UPI004059838B